MSGGLDKTIWTVGHSVLSAENFLELLQNFNIEHLADVRRFPGSKRLPHFNKDELNNFLATNGIGYTHFESLGGRRPVMQNSIHSEWKNKSFRGYADYSDTAEFNKALSGLEKLGMQFRTAFMCSEAVWWRCHRSIIADKLKDRGWTVLHILDKKTLPKEHPYTAPARAAQEGLF